MNKSIVIKKDVTNEDVIKAIGPYKRILIATSKHLHSIFTERIDKLKKALKADIYFVDSYGLDDAFKLCKELLRSHIDVLVSIGGGTINDVCKLASENSRVRLVSIPTIVSNDGVCSNISVLRVDDVHTESFASKSPDVIIVDVDIIKNTPAKFLAAGLGDILSNYTSVWDWDLAVAREKETPNDLARIMSSNAFWTLFNLPDNIEEDLKIKLICESIIMSGLAMEIKGNSRPCSGSEHLFNHAIMAYYPEINVLHGFLVALGSLVSCIFQNQNFEKMVGFLKKHNIDVRPSTLGISKEIFIDAWMKATSTRPNRYTILNEIKLNEKMLSNIYDKIEKEAY